MIAGIEQGRTIYADIRKAVRFILATNMSEILLMLISIASGLGEALTPMQLLWLNLMTDIAPELALAVHPPDPDVLRRPPRDPRQPMFDRAALLRIAGEGTVLTAGALAAFVHGLRRYGPGPQASTLAFSALTGAQLLHLLSARSERRTIFEPSGDAAPNRYIPLALGGSLGLQALAVLLPPTRRLLGIARLSALDWGVAGLAAVCPLLINEAVKLALRDRPAASDPASLRPDGDPHSPQP
jgi:Ca2+-transporting ATPase